AMGGRNSQRLHDRGHQGRIHRPPFSRPRSMRLGRGGSLRIRDPHRSPFADGSCAMTRWLGSLLLFTLACDPIMSVRASVKTPSNVPIRDATIRMRCPPSDKAEEL